MGGSSCPHGSRRQFRHVEQPQFQHRPLALAIAPDGTPVAAHADDVTGGIDVITRDSPTCDRPRVTPPTASVQPRAGEGASKHAVRRDGRPLIAYLDIRTTASVLLNCRSKVCVQVGRARPTP